MPKEEHGESTPTVIISRRGADRLRSGHVWVYRSDVLGAKDIPPGSLVNVKDERNRLLGSALYSAASEIAIRMMSTKPDRAACSEVDFERPGACNLRGITSLSRLGSALGIGRRATYERERLLPDGQIQSS